MQNNNHILYVVVLYGQKYEMTNVYKSLLIKVNQRDVWIWDNSENRNINAHLNFGESNYSFSEVNAGLSFPYNCASEYAFRNNYQWMMLLDQDTEFDISFLDILSVSMRENPDINLFCPLHRLSNDMYLSPVKSILKFTRLSKTQVSGVFNIADFCIINSGIVVNVATFRKAGGYNEKVFLDYSDFQFLDRFAKVESNAFCINSVCIQDFSDNCIDKDKLLNRFSLFCESLKGVSCNTLKDCISYKLVVLKRCISLIIRLRNFSPLNILLKKYLR